MAHGGCPFGYDRALTPVERERARAHFAESHRGRQMAAGRPALGFTLDHSTRSEIVEKMSALGARCASGHGLSDLTCTNVPRGAPPGATAPLARTLWFTFGTSDQLMSVVSVSRAANVQAISDAFVTARDTLTSQAGAATESRGSADAHSLARALLIQASAEYRFKNYYAVQRVANMGRDYVLTEEYHSLPD
jgi:hypothetical protein